MKIRLLIEAFKVYVKPDWYSKRNRGAHIPIFENPTTAEKTKKRGDKQSEDIRGDDGFTRAIIDIPNKKVYMFSSNLLHYKAAKKIGVPYSHASKEYIPVIGVVDPESLRLLVGRREFVGLGKEGLENLKKETWLKKHITVTK